MLKTVKVKHPDLENGVLINECDFDKSKHELWGQKSPVVKSDPVAEVKPTVKRRGKK